MDLRMWAAIGNALRIFSIPMFLGTLLMGMLALEFVGTRLATPLILVLIVFGAVNLVFALLFFFAKGPLVDGNVVVRFLAGIYVLLSIISTGGVSLIFLGVVYLFTSDPEVYRGIFAERKPVKRTFATPQNWEATGRIGPSGATVYSTAQRDDPVGIFESWIPVQVFHSQDGFTRVLAASGEGGWIDDRVLLDLA